MSDVSNRTIVALLAVALVVSVAGTMYSVSELGALGGSYTVLSGAATQGDGTTELDISGVASISVTDNGVDFGSGYVSTSSSTGYADLNTDESVSWVDWTNTTNGDVESGDSGNTGFRIVNDGSRAVTLDVVASENAEEWLCAAGGCTSSDSSVGITFEMDSDDGEGDDSLPSCDSANGNMQTGYNVLMPNTGTPASIHICDYMFPQDNKDEITADLWVRVNDDASAGAHSTTITFSAVDAQ